jgi:hypothetical protein
MFHLQELGETKTRFSAEVLCDTPLERVVGFGWRVVLSLFEL